MSEKSRALREVTVGPELPATSYHAKVTRAAVAGEQLSVVLKDTADLETLELIVPNWIAKPDSSDPQVGDECLVQLDASGAGWVTAWAGRG
jgi:hypothetical protein